jgi:hypothetical protein
MQPFTSGRRHPANLGKQVYELTLDDLVLHPIWEFRLDPTSEVNQNESTVWPHHATGPLDSTDRMFIVRALFFLADGSTMVGYLTPPVKGDSGIGALQPIIVTARGQVRFWCGTTVPDAKRLARGYQFLGKNAAAIFPLRFESDVKLVSGPVEGSLPGFLVMEDFQTRKARTIT